MIYDSLYNLFLSYKAVAVYAACLEMWKAHEYQVASGHYERYDIFWRVKPNRLYNRKLHCRYVEYKAQKMQAYVQMVQV